MSQAFEKQEERKDRQKPLRQALPDAAALMDEVRAMFGAEWADQALREGIKLQREHARRLAQHGQAQADAWLDMQGSAVPVLRIQQEGRAVGALPGRRPMRTKGRAR